MFELINQRTGSKFVHLPYKGAAQAMGFGTKLQIKRKVAESNIIFFLVLNEELPMTLNVHVNWHELPEFVRNAFQTNFGMPTKDLIDPPTVLYKFNDFQTLHSPGNNKLSPWWSPYPPYKNDAGWEEKKRMAVANGISVREWGRLTSAVKENWNSLQYLLVITLKEPVYGFFGGFAQMQRIDPNEASKLKAGEGRGGSRNLPGGGTQFYIPNLTADHVRSWRVEDLSSR